MHKVRRSVRRMAVFRRTARGGVAAVEVDHPPANALDPDFLVEVLALLDELHREPPRAVVLAGKYDFFSGGANLKVVPRLSPDEQAEMTGGVNRLFHAFHNPPGPVVTAVNGHAIAGGLILALCGDHRVAGAKGKFGLTEVK